MKKVFIVLSLMLAACAGSLGSIPAPGTCPDGGIASATLMDERAYAGALIAYNVPAQAYKTANERGQLSADLKVQVRPLLIKMYDGLQVLKAALEAGNTASFQCQLGSIYRASNEAKSLLGVH